MPTQLDAVKDFSEALRTAGDQYRGNGQFSARAWPEAMIRLKQIEVWHRDVKSNAIPFDLVADQQHALIRVERVGLIAE